MERNILIYNNTTCPVLVEMPSGVQKRLTRTDASIKVNMEELEFIYAISPAALEEGILIIKDEKVRETLGISKFYHDGSIVLHNNIDEILKQDAKTLKKTLSKASKTAKDDIAKKASGKAGKLTGEAKEEIEKATGKNLDIDKE